MPDPMKAETTEALCAAHLRWVAHCATFYSLMLGRIELVQIAKGYKTEHWFWTLRLCLPGEKSSYSEPTCEAAEAIAMAHAQKVLTDA